MVIEMLSDYCWFLLLVLGAFLYYYKFKIYTVRMEGNYDTRRKKMGKTLPPHPNGWFIMCRSAELAKGQVKEIHYWGQNIALFRGQDGIAYALEAYCAHLGANLAIGGTIKYGNCIQCPFHGWTYSGQTGHCVGIFQCNQDYNKKPQKGICYQYNDDFVDKGKTLTWKKSETDIKIKKYHIKEINNLIFVWLHSDPQREPQYEVPNLESIIGRLSYRGTSTNIIKCHLEDIAWNGADYLHFFYIHKYLVSFTKRIFVNWIAKWLRADDPDIKSLFSHKIDYVDKYKKLIYKSLIEDNPGCKYISVGSVDSYVNIPFFKQFYGWNITIVQIGPGFVYIFVTSRLFQIAFVQYVQTEGKYRQILNHDIYTNKWLPYWYSALLLHGQAIQVYNDTFVWDAKQFKKKIVFKVANNNDETLKNWSEWYAQFYEGCAENGSHSLDW